MVLYFTDEVPGSGRKGTKFWEISGRISAGTRVVAGLDLSLGEDLQVRDELTGHSRLGCFCRGETEAREDSSISQPSGRAKSYLGGRGSKMDRQQ